jgi:hypothetical protein
VSVFAACGGGGKSDANPKEVVNEATLKGIESGDVDLSLQVKTTGGKANDFDVSLSGPFQGEGKGNLPLLDMTAKVNGSIKGKDVNFEGGLVLLSNSGYVNYEGTEYEIDPTSFSFVQSALKPQGGGESESAGVTACQDAAGKLDVGSMVDNLSNEGSADVGGTNTTKISGDLNVTGAIDSLTEISEDPACKAQLNSVQSFPSAAKLREAKDEVQAAVKTAHVDLYIGDDDIVRRVVAQVELEPKKAGNGTKSAEVKFDLTLTGVNDEQEISAPGKAKPLNDLFLKLGINPIDLLNALNGGGEGLGSLLEGVEHGNKAGEGLGNLLEGIGGGSGGNRQAYLKCLGEATTPVELQHCATL